MLFNLYLLMLLIIRALLLNNLVKAHRAEQNKFTKDDPAPDVPDSIWNERWATD